MNIRITSVAHRFHKVRRRHEFISYRWAPWKHLTYASFIQFSSFSEPLSTLNAVFKFTFLFQSVRSLLQFIFKFKKRFFVYVFSCFVINFESSAYKLVWILFPIYWLTYTHSIQKWWKNERKKNRLTSSHIELSRTYLRIDFSFKLIDA